ncbi:unnamed protein product [Lactuca saligna]|uniref:Glycosyltransferase 2-like domain-containing protein n=1 Tax=Lactuca saligna TaxID=75948 RepID=A0AA35VL47_LACSI|nr:unnamed protein product [Lactuca saligna]
MGRLSATIIVLESFTGSGGDIIAHIIEIWGQFRVPVLVPLLTLLLYVSLGMSIMLFIEKVYMSSVVGFNYLFGRKTEKCYKWEEFKNDVESGNSVYPLVLIQVPMFNEREVYQLSIGAACGLSWPSDRIVIQVLDDSTDPVVKDMVEVECHKWASKGTNIHYQPESDFLRKTIPFLHHNSEIGLVQARWKFANSDECLMTRMQEMSLNYHFKVEQEFGSSTHAFFGFNGTAGVWRMAAINEAGGWKDRTTVEDMDLAVRASLKGWKFLYLGSIKVKNELPSVFKAYRFQQHRWSCGPANLFRKMIYEIMMNKKVALWKKLHVIYSFFFVRKIVAHIGTFMLYCVVIPASVWIPEVEVPIWATVYIPTVITILNAVATPRSFYLVVFWVVFENVMALHRTKATFIGLFETQRVNEWVVTEKHGDASKAKSAITHQRRLGLKLSDRFLVLEFCMGIILFISGCYDLAYGKYYYYIYLYLQAIAFVVTGLGYVGTHIPNS